MAFINDLLNLLNTYGKFQVTKPDGSVETATELVITENGVRHTVWKAGNNVTYFVDNNVSYTVEVDNGANILNPTAFTPSKNGYTFVGWRRDKIATGTVLNAAVMEGDPITLYAVFRKDITLTYYNATSKAATITDKQYYNNGNITNPKFTLEQLEAPSWESRGWATNSKAEAAIAYENISEREFSADTTVYALYQRTITLSYDGNGSTGGSVDAQSGIRYWNSAGNYANPSFVLTSNGFSKTNYLFIGWDLGSVGAVITLAQNTTARAQWLFNTISTSVSHGDTSSEEESWRTGTFGTFDGLDGIKTLTVSVDYTITCDNNWGGNAAKIYLTVGNNTQLVFDRAQWASDSWSGSSGMVTLTVDVSSVYSVNVSAHGAVWGAGGTIALTVKITDVS